jgi:hypothetical protein
MRTKARKWTPEEWRVHWEHQERLRESTDAVIHAVLDAIEAGGDDAALDAAARAAREEVMGPDAAALPSAASADIPVDTVPRLVAPGWTAEKQREFLVHLSETGCVSEACEHFGMSRQSGYALRRRAPNSVFAIGWDVAIYMARQAMLDEATERAIRGREVEIWYHGERVGTRIVHNDKMLMFLLSMKREALHPRLDAREMTHLFPAMLKMVDAMLPSAITAERIARLTREDRDAEDEFG